MSMSKVPLVKIIECLATGDRAKAVAYAEHLVRTLEDKYNVTGNIWDKYDIMTARNVLHVLKGEPKEGGVAVCDGAMGTRASDSQEASVPSAADFWLKHGVNVEVVDHL